MILDVFRLAVQELTVEVETWLLVDSKNRSHGSLQRANTIWARVLIFRNKIM